MDEVNRAAAQGTPGMDKMQGNPRLSLHFDVFSAPDDPSHGPVGPDLRRDPKMPKTQKQIEVKKSIKDRVEV